MHQMMRLSGILAHPTSFPGRFGIGDLGPSAYQFVDFLVDTKQSLWQILPLGPTSYGDSPYQCLSAFAGNPLLISPEQLQAEGCLSSETLNNAPDFPKDRVDYGGLFQWKRDLLKEAFQGFQKNASEEERLAMRIFCEKQAHWLDDYVCFAAIKEDHGLRAWNEWTPALKLRDPAALEEWKSKNGEQILYHQFIQYQFYKQWQSLKGYAHEKGIRIIGDIPIFVAYDSAEVWAHPEFFELDEQGSPRVIAGVPPDYFSKTGQRWGNPLYCWKKMAEDDYHWWRERIVSLLEFVDMIRIDHFRGFEAYWEIPASEPTAMNGKWVKGPDIHLFETMKRYLGELPIIAEDLGIITPEVESLRDDCGFPGMKILQFGFVRANAEDSKYLPHHHIKHCLVYTGTHDNNTTRGWYSEIPEEGRKAVEEYVGQEVTEENVCPLLIRQAFGSVADTIVIPLQDILNLGEEARMNFPGKESGNWTWRFQQEDLTDEIRAWLASLSEIYERN